MKTIPGTCSNWPTEKDTTKIPKPHNPASATACCRRAGVSWSRTPVTLAINIDDDMPGAKDNSITADAGSGGTLDISFIVDVSGSMTDGGSTVNDVPGFPDNRLGLARYSMTELLNNHPEVKNVLITIFDNDASSSVWMSRSSAIAYIADADNFDGGGTTNYDAALTSMMGAYPGARPEGQADETVVLFLSDGVPNPTAAGIDGDGSGSNVSITEWQDFLNIPANDISDVFAVGLGGSVSFTNLNPISYPNTDSGGDLAEDRVILVPTSNVTGLVDAFDAAVSSVVTPVTGNLVNDDAPGADGWASPKLASVTYDTDGSGPSSAVSWMPTSAS